MVQIGEKPTNLARAAQRNIARGVHIFGAVTWGGGGQARETLWPDHDRVLGNSSGPTDTARGRTTHSPTNDTAQKPRRAILLLRGRQGVAAARTWSSRCRIKSAQC